MGLSGSFGNQQYLCEDCGHTMALYAPHCPVCLSKKLTRPQVERNPGRNPTPSVNEGPTETAPKSSMAGFGITAVIIALLVAAYTMFGPKPEPSSTRSAEPAARPEASPRRVVNYRPAKRASVNPVRQTAKPRSASASGGSAPRRAAPMKLWEASGDNE